MTAYSTNNKYMIAKPAFSRASVRSRTSALIIAGAVMAMTACGEPAQPADVADAVSDVVALTNADVAEARIDTIAGGVMLSGPLEPASSVSLKAQVDGTISALNVDRGSPVRRGQLLLTIAAEGVREQAASTASAIAAAKAGVAVAEQRRDGALALFAKGAISEVDRRVAEAQYEAAVAELLAVQAAATGAEEMASRTRVISPIDGVISDRFVERGEPVSNGAHMLTVVDVRTLELAGQVGVDLASQLATGMSVEFTSESRPDRTYRGRVARIDPVADAGTRQVGVYVELPNADRQLVAGQFVTGRVLMGSPAAHVVVPAPALRMRDGKTVVAVVADGRVRLQNVTVATRDDARGLVGIASGIEAGAKVLIMPGAGLEDGTQVRIVNTTAPDDTGRPPIAPIGDKQ